MDNSALVKMATSPIAADSVVTMHLTATKKRSATSMQSTTVSSNPAYKSRYVALVEKYKSSFGTLAQNSIPANSQFFVWNRFFLIEYENLLREVECRITMPYYDWTVLYTNPYIHPVYDDKTGFGKSAS